MVMVGYGMVWYGMVKYITSMYGVHATRVYDSFVPTQEYSGTPTPRPASEKRLCLDGLTRLRH
ncbi:hypothetical protein VFPPC_15853 [Pochonia chlamydosporia 170]|uniref:Uncharacterized protein n=1 Tax=Pochonia chlamydosporia 170 TaxID=1380566 RepID=A0A179FSR2_METCM|nr:hypothetical protein VFPPC_15853 [Pochonia chlamydosporia 170]OAQ68634.2 hypothetical protein VFPPC_15853 [Pochonia chlamydosporia 170]